jgi:hypothetical protein
MDSPIMEWVLKQSLFRIVSAQSSMCLSAWRYYQTVHALALDVLSLICIYHNYDSSTNCM